MEKELNIAAILKGKPKARLYDELHNIKVELDKVSTINDVTTIWCKRELPNKVQHFGYSERGTERGWLDGLQILFPSKQMRDWSKFAWKKGDVLIYSDILVIFDKWANDDYSEFKAAFEFKRGSNYFDKGNTYYTSEFCKAIDEITNNFIKEIEEHYGGKLNLETLEIEKPQFKDGDIVVVDYVEGATFICICEKVEDNFMYCHARMNSHNKDLFLKKAFLKVNLDNKNPRLAKEDEKQQFFSDLEKKNKAWDAEKKQIVDLPSKCELKPFDKVLVRDDLNNHWRPYFFYKVDPDKDYPYTMVNGEVFSECIPYNEQTAHLLGTTDDWEGGRNDTHRRNEPRHTAG